MFPRKSISTEISFSLSLYSKNLDSQVIQTIWGLLVIFRKRGKSVGNFDGGTVNKYTIVEELHCCIWIKKSHSQNIPSSKYLICQNLKSDLWSFFAGQHPRSADREGQQKILIKMAMLIYMITAADVVLWKDEMMKMIMAMMMTFETFAKTNMCGDGGGRKCE